MNAVNSTPTALPGRFRSVEQLVSAGVDQDRTRAFVGDGTDMLRLPYCTRVDAVRIGTMPLPETEVRKYPIDAAGRLQEVVEPLWKVDVLPDGTPVLLRAIISNDGIWQKDANIYITGEWDTKAEDKAKAEAAKKN